MTPNEVLATSVSHKATWTGSIAMMLSWLADEKVLGLLGLVIALLGVAINWYYRAKENRYKAEENRRAQELHEKRMRDYEN
jgi:hypothetical protein